MKTESLSVDLPRIDGDTQSRIGINEDAVQDYADLISSNNGDWPFPPIDVFFDGTDYYVGNGFHRFLAAHRAKRGSIPCTVHKGSARDARIFGMTANDKQGLRMSREDKRANVEWLLDEGGNMTQAVIAETAGVSVRTVKTIVAERKPQWTPSSKGGGATSGGEKEQVAPFTPKSATPGSTPHSVDLTCPNCHGTDFDEDGDCTECHEPAVSPEPGKPRKPIVVTGEHTDAFYAKQQVKVWAETIGRWLGQTPSIDEYRAKFPGEQGDKVVKAATGLFEALKKWQKGIK